MFNIEKQNDNTLTCDMCGGHFTLTTNRRYTARDDGKLGFSKMTGDEPRMYDAIDCPHCGCQKLLQIRLRPANDIMVDEEIREVKIDNE